MAEDLNAKLGELLEACFIYGLEPMHAILEELPLGFRHSEERPSDLIWGEMKNSVQSVGEKGGVGLNESTLKVGCGYRYQSY